MTVPSIPYSEQERSRHTGITVGATKTVVGRHQEIENDIAEAIFRQLEDAWGKGWWRP